MILPFKYRKRIFELYFLPLYLLEYQKVAQKSFLYQFP